MNEHIFFVEIEKEISEYCESKDEHSLKELAASKLNDRNDYVSGKINKLNLSNISISKQNESLEHQIIKAGKVFEISKCEGMPK